MTCEICADPAVGVWNVVEVADVDFFLDIKALGPRRNLFVHHFCSSGRDSVGLDLEDVANATDLVVAACRDFKFEAELKLDILISIFLLIYSLEMIDYRLHKTTRWMYFRFVAGSVVHANIS